MRPENVAGPGNEARESLGMGLYGRLLVRV